VRKLLVAMVCLCAAVPAVALAADDSNVKASGTTPPAIDKKIWAKGQARKIERRREKAKAKRRRAKAARASSGGASPALEAIAACESGGNPSAIGGGGAYRGKYQFDYGTWASVGGSGDPAAASEAEQDKRAAMLYARSGSAPWPVCGQ
jgi:transglycosylase-like protein